MKSASLSCASCRAPAKGSIQGAVKKLEKLLEENEDLPIAAKIRGRLEGIR